MAEKATNCTFNLFSPAKNNSPESFTNFSLTAV